MPNRFVTVASYANTPEAQMAKNLLEAEGIPAMLTGVLAADLLIGNACEADLQVREEDAQRAVALLATASAQASLDEDWEAQAALGLWTCPVCGTAIRVGEDTCPACGTSNASIITDRRDTWAPPNRRPREAELVKKSDQIQADAPRSLIPGVEGEDETTARRSGPGCMMFVLFGALGAILLLG